jgi:hypothetical protein
VLKPEDFEAAVAAIPKTAGPGEETAFRWAKWLLAPAATRPLSPLEDQPFAAYLSSLKEEGSPAAARELLRYRPKDRDAVEKAKQFKPSPPK